jgi:hypothetical protein
MICFLPEAIRKGEYWSHLFGGELVEELHWTLHARNNLLDGQLN